MAGSSGDQDKEDHPTLLEHTDTNNSVNNAEEDANPESSTMNIHNNEIEDREMKEMDDNQTDLQTEVIQSCQSDTKLTNETQKKNDLLQIETMSSDNDVAVHITSTENNIKMQVDDEADSAALNESNTITKNESSEKDSVIEDFQSKIEINSSGPFIVDAVLVNDNDKANSVAVNETKYDEVKFDNDNYTERKSLSNDVDIKSEPQVTSDFQQSDIAINTVHENNQNMKITISDISEKDNVLSDIQQSDILVKSSSLKLDEFQANYFDAGKKYEPFQYIGVPYLLKSLGFEANYPMKTLKEIWKDKTKNKILNLSFDSTDKKEVKECETIYSSNWPKWLRPSYLQFILELFTDINKRKTPFYAEILTYTQKKLKQGAFLLHLPNNEECMRVFKELKKINIVNSHYKVELDIGNKITNTVCRISPDGVRLQKEQWLDPNLTEHYRFRITRTSTDSPDNDGSSTRDPHPGTCTRLIPNSPTHAAQAKYIQEKMMVINIPPGQIKQVIKKRTLAQLKTLPDHRPLLKGTRPCKGIFMKNWPTWFAAMHFAYVLDLLTYDFDWQNGDYFIEVLQYSNGKNMGAALVRFKDQATCLKIFKQVQRIYLLIHSGDTLVELDIDNKIASKIKAGDPKVKWQSSIGLNPIFRSRDSITSIEMPDNYKEDICPDSRKEKRGKKHALRNIITVKNETFNETTFNVGNNIAVDKDTDESIATQSLNQSSDDCVIVETEQEIIDLVDEDGKETKKKKKRNKAKKQTDDTGCKIVYVKNLPNSLKASNFYNIIKHMVQTNTTFNTDQKSFYIRILRDIDMKPLTECLLKFDAAEDAIAVATGLDGIAFGNSQIEASLDIGYKKLNEIDSIPKFVATTKKLENVLTDDKDRWKRPMFDAEWGILGAGTSYMRTCLNIGETYGLNKGLLKNCGLDPLQPLTNVVIVSNLHECVSESKLYEVFSLAGEVIRVSLVEVKQQATIEFDHPVEAVQAISMFDKQKLFGEAMNVTMDHDAKQKSLPAGLSAINAGLGANGEPLKGIRAILELKPLYEVLGEVGILRKVYRHKDPFLIHYKFQEGTAYSYGVNKGPTTYPKNARPDVDTAIEALGTVLVALELIPPTIDCKNLLSIVNALKDNPKVKNRVQNYNKKFKGPNQYSREWYPRKGNDGFNSGPGFSNLQQMQNSVPSGSQMNQPSFAINTTAANPAAAVEGLQQVLTDFVQKLANAANTAPNSQFTGPSSQFAGPNFTNTGNNYPHHNTAEYQPNLNPSNPDMACVPPNMNTNINSGMPNLNSNSGMPNLNPDMGNINHRMPNVNPGMLNINSGNSNENLGMSNINHGMPNVNPGMRDINSGMSQLGPGMHNINPDMSNKNPGMPNINLDAPISNAGKHNAYPGTQNVNPSTSNAKPGSSTQSQTSIQQKTDSPSSSKWDQLPQFPVGQSKTSQATTSKWDQPPKFPIGQSKTSQATTSSDNFTGKQRKQKARYFNRSLPKEFYDDDENGDDDRRLHQNSSSYRKRKLDEDDIDGVSDDDSHIAPQKCVLQFSNLPPSVNKYVLNKKMQEIGELVFTEITGIGRALVQFKSIKDAERCQKLFHRSKVDGCIIDVKLCRR